MKLFHKRSLVLMSALLVALFTTACHDDVISRGEIPDPAPTPGTEVPGTDGFYEVSIPFSASDLRGADTRALDKAGENAILAESVRAFVFQKTVNSLSYLYEAKVTKVTPDATKDNAEGNISILIKDSGEELVKVFFVVNATPTSAPTVGMTPEQFGKLFLFSQKTTTDWAAGELPMYAESEEVRVNHSAGAVPSLQSHPIPFLRAVARVDVILGAMSGDKFDETTNGLQAPGGQEIKLVSIKAYNVADKGLAIPLAANVQTPATAPKVTATSLPADVAKLTDPIVYLSSTDGVNSLMRTIYLPESDNKPHQASADSGETLPEVDQTNYLSRPFLVLGIKGAVKEDADKVTYFRVDYLKRTGDEATAAYEYLDLLRNYRYLVNIVAVGGPGFDNEEDAKKGPAANIMYNVQAWSESEISNVKYDGQYMLKVSAKELEVNRYGGSIALKLETSWPKGWTIDNIDALENHGITVSQSKSTVGKETEEETITIEVGTLPEGDPAWELPLVIKAGRIIYEVKLTQTEKSEISIKLFSDPECTQPLSYLQIHELGKGYDTTTEGKHVLKEDGVTPMDRFEVGAEQKFYARIQPAAAGVTLLKVQPRGGDRFDFRQYVAPDNWDQWAASDAAFTGKLLEPAANGVYEFRVSADEMVNEADYFEHKRNEYEFILSLKDEPDVTATATLILQQVEYNIQLFSDELLTNPVSLDPDEPEYYMMNGQEKKVYVKSNMAGYIELIKQGQREDFIKDGIDLGVPMTSITGRDAAKTSFTIDNSTLEVNRNTPQDIYYFFGDMGSASPREVYSFITRDDIKATNKMQLGVSTWRLHCLNPLYSYKFREGGRDGIDYLAEFLCVAVQPEANSYVMELGDYGLLIPLSRINTAADVFYREWEKPERWDEQIHGVIGAAGDKEWVTYYKGPLDWNEFMLEENHGLHHLDPDDDPTPEFIWSDVQPMKEAIGRVLYDPTSKDKSDGPIKHMEVASFGGEDYLIVIPGDSKPENVGNTLIAVRSSKYTKKETGIVSVDTGTWFPENKSGSKAILWSWHIITVEKGKRDEYLTVLYPKPANGEEHPGFLNKEMGARRRTEIGKSLGTATHLAWQPDDYTVLGMTYQFGRKDPFPNEDYGGQIGYENLRYPFLKNAKGQIFHTEFYNGYRMTYKQSIENPTVAVTQQYGGAAHWMVEGGFETTSGPLRSSSKYQISYIWGGRPLGSSSERENYTGETQKTVFDPSPYGFKMPAVGRETTWFMYPHGDISFQRDQLFANRNPPVMFKGPNIPQSTFLMWSGPSSRKRSSAAGGDRPEVWFHTSCPVYGGMGRAGVFVLKRASPYFSGNIPINPMSKSSVIPYFPIINWRESDYPDYFRPKSLPGSVHVPSYPF